MTQPAPKPYRVVQSTVRGWDVVSAQTGAVVANVDRRARARELAAEYGRLREAHPSAWRGQAAQEPYDDMLRRQAAPKSAQVRYQLAAAHQANARDLKQMMAAPQAAGLSPSQFFDMKDDERLQLMKAHQANVPLTDAQQAQMYGFEAYSNQAAEVKYQSNFNLQAVPPAPEIPDRAGWDEPEPDHFPVEVVVCILLFVIVVVIGGVTLANFGPWGG